MNSTKILMIFMLMFSFLLMSSSNNYMSMWMSLEINMMAFIPLILNYKNYNSSKNMMIYFIIQTISSIIFLFSVINNLYFNNKIIYLIMMISLFMKLGMPPFHSWILVMINKISWYNLLILLTLQKIIPMMILSYIMKNEIMILLVISSLMSAIGGINQNNLMKMMTYSSMNHISWMNLSMLFESNMWIMYLIIYSLLMFFFCNIMNNNNIYFINQINLNMNYINKFSIIIIMLSLGGLPPFLGFLPKWMIIQYMINLNMFFFMFLILLMSLVILFYYMQIIMSMLMFNFNMLKLNMKKNMNNEYISIIFFMNLILPMIMIFNFF
uniref:NADH-ubiquinone oxidoreductase chain 2 n=1 Tax=Oncylocotis sp. PJ-2015 TaxID=1663423 RepID=A0A342D254_9HEMI|nr:NADH dehydrogenase subunit 2 [Oncylocotis sp. PJ-2015]